MLPLARTALRRIGTGTDVVTYISQYTRGRFASAFGPDAALEHLAPGVGHRPFAPDEVARAELRARYKLGERPVVVCVSRLVPRKGQDMLIRAMPAIRQRVPGAALVIVGGGPYGTALRRLADRFGVAEHVVFTDGVPGDELPAHHAMADVFAMPCRTRGGGMDVEGLGIVYLEAVGDGRAGLSRAGPAGRPKPSGTARRVWWSTAWTSARSLRRSATYWPTRTGPRRWVTRQAMGRRQLAVDHQGAAARRTALAVVVQRLDIACELLGDNLALDLQGRRQFARVLGESTRQDAEFADRLGMGHRLIGFLTARSTSAVKSGSLARSPTVAVASLPCRCFQPGTPRGRW